MYIDLPERIGPMGIKTMKAFNRTKGEVFFLEISIKNNVIKYAFCNVMKR